MSRSLPFGADEATNFVNAWQQTFVIAAHERNYKGGAFKNKINASTSALEAVDIILGSGLLSEEEEPSFLEGRQAFLTALSRGPRMTSTEAVVLGLKSCGMLKVFEADAKKRGQYVPPMMIQALGENREVTKTFEITDEGVKETIGGTFGHIPSAPTEWNRRSQEKWGFKDTEKSNKDDQIAKPNNPGSLGASPADGIGNGVKEESADKVVAERKERKKSKVHASGDFGAAFKQNLRGAFM